MTTATIHDAKTNLSKYIAAVKKGQDIYIGSFGKAEVLLTRLPFNGSKTGTRDFSAAKGKIFESDEAFSESTEAEVTKMMLGA
jgi:antitoxin (DNA-binding transcriptional repressor) of toxin-antitoxin stability system